MREALKNAVQSAILFECQLPHQESGLGKSCLSSQNDICFNNTDPQEIAKVIYNGIVEFALNEYEINYDDLEREQRRAILSRIRYNPTADNYGVPFKLIDCYDSQAEYDKEQFDAYEKRVDEQVSRLFQ